MHNHIMIRQAANRVVLSAIFLATALLSSGIVVFAADSAASAQPAAQPKTHVLFIGANIELERDKVFQPVEGATADAYLIKSDGKQVKVALTQNSNLRITETLKIARTSVTVTKFKSEPAYTPGADPFRQFFEASLIADTHTDATDHAQGEVVRLTFAPVVDSSPIPNQERAIAAQWAKVDTSRDSMFSSMQEDTRLKSELTNLTPGQEKFDAIKVSFEAVPEKDLEHPYCAVVAQVREPSSEPGHTRRIVYVKSFSSMRAGATQKVMIFEGGLPPGYILENAEVHFYDNGQELATSLSRKRVPLTDDEAFQYSVIDYIGTHKGATVRPQLLIAESDRAQVERLVQRITTTCYLRVTKQGRVTDVFTDASRKNKLADAELAAHLSDLRFYPALEKGAPIEVLVPLEPGHLSL